MLALLVVAAAALTGAPAALAEYSPRMEPGRLAVRHACWAAAARCRPTWPADGGGSVEMRITLDRRGRVRALATDPPRPAFARCVRRALRGQRFSVTGPDAAGDRWEVVSRYVFPDVGGDG